jgi:hypothetical protein
MIVNYVLCSVDGCSNVFQTSEDVTANVRFMCRHHPRKIQVLTNDRLYNPDTDHEDEAIRFQDVAFDPKLGVKSQKKAKRATSEPLPWPTTLRN